MRLALFLPHLVRDKDVLKVSANRLYRLSREQIFSSITHDAVESTEIDRGFQLCVSIFFFLFSFFAEHFLYLCISKSRFKAHLSIMKIQLTPRFSGNLSWWNNKKGKKKEEEEERENGINCK